MKHELQIDEVVPGQHDSFASINPKEVRVLELTSHGLNAKEISQQLFYQHSTIANRLVDIKKKLGAASTAQAVRFGFECSVLQPEADPKLNPAYTPSLSPRELECVLLIGEGMSNNQIAHELNLSLRTIRTHVSNLLVSLIAKNRSHAIRRVIEFGILDWYSLGPRA